MPNSFGRDRQANGTRSELHLVQAAQQAGGGSFYEFFAGGGMARAGLGVGWNCLLANDFDPKKEASYRLNWGDLEFEPGSVGDLSLCDLPGQADLAWASFPCQDLSLAGSGAGLKGARSGTFWPFWRLIEGLNGEKRKPTLIVLENVCGALTSHGGADFRALLSAVGHEGYRFGALIIDAVHFVPQSRPRLFIIAIDEAFDIPAALFGKVPDPAWTPASLIKACDNLDEEQRQKWVWWHLPSPKLREKVFSDLIEDQPTGVTWHTTAETRRLVAMMSPLNRSKLEKAKRTGRRVAGAIYKRTRADENGIRRQRAEVRFDDIAGCLRTPVGGSSRQLIMIVEGEAVRSRLLSPREAAALMGLKNYILPEKYNDAYHLAGDGLVVPVVRHLAEHILEPLLAAARRQKRVAA